MKHTVEEIQEWLINDAQKPRGCAVVKTHEEAEIISDLVKEVIDNGLWLIANRQTNKVLGFEIKDLKEKNKRLEDAIQKLIMLNDPVITAIIAKALEGK